ncbi:hypothetical protein CRG98_022526 [Punica granatum]|uniref:Retroviral polymerase SH3-like domain-containing protein n=1 Tax=Punica granatum TaxID=22663 RepID=A0A2I0JL68_PUNGR|nr:hypothetical protein CRG98_022526 [Punica granatum]
MFVGYPYDKKGWRVYDLEKNEIFVTRDVRFCEREFPFLQMNDAGKEDMGQVRFFTDTEKHVCQVRSQGESRFRNLTEGERENGLTNPLGPMGNQGEESDELEHLTDEQFRINNEPLTQEMDDSVFLDRSCTGVEAAEHTLRRSDRVKSAPKYLKDFEVRIHTALHTPTVSPTSSKSSGMVHSIQQYLSYSGASNRYLAYISALDSEVEPTSYRDATANPRWRQAMAEEIKALESNGTWTIEDLPPGKRPIDCK